MFARSLFEPRFNRVEIYGLLFAMWLAMILQNPYVVLGALPLIVIGHIGERRLRAKHRP